MSVKSHYMTKHSTEGRIAIIVVYVNKHNIDRDHEKEICELKKFFSQDFEIERLGESQILSWDEDRKIKN